MEKSSVAKNLALDIASINLFWSFYIYDEDFPEIPDFRKKYGLIVNVKQLQFIHEKYKGQSKTLFWTDKNKAWGFDTPDKNKRIICDKLEKVIQNESGEYTGKHIDPIVAQYIPKEQEVTYNGMLFA